MHEIQPAFILKSLIAIDAFNCCHCGSLAHSIALSSNSLILFSSIVRWSFGAVGLNMYRHTDSHASEYFPFFSISIIFGNFGIQKNFDYIRCTAYNTHTSCERQFWNNIANRSAGSKYSMGFHMFSFTFK